MIRTTIMTGGTSTGVVLLHTEPLPVVALVLAAVILGFLGCLYLVGKMGGRD
jgi:hypothetical protein